ncbi:unnamed protein product [Dovyalis caffra]|uniref:Uncharacterized protein n=1 Tax=Dovyalis caffra TaxID=77055 RepID=A0AAV1S487_9ROSI|nr:unnamed protein product [Dovyalis caffra]
MVQRAMLGYLIICKINRPELMEVHEQSIGRETALCPFMGMDSRDWSGPWSYKTTLKCQNRLFLTQPTPQDAKDPGQKMEQVVEESYNITLKPSHGTRQKVKRVKRILDSLIYRRELSK